MASSSPDIVPRTARSQRTPPLRFVAVGLKAMMVILIAVQFVPMGAITAIRHFSLNQLGRVRRRARCFSRRVATATAIKRSGRGTATLLPSRGSSSTMSRKGDANLMYQNGAV